MEMRTVYRYEDSYGRGPYRGGNWTDYETKLEMCYAHIGGHHPTWAAEVWPEDLRSYQLTRRYLAACASREALDAWFDGWQSSLEENGFSVIEYTVPADHVIDASSGLQCAFKPM